MHRHTRIESLERRVLFAAGDLDPTFGGGDGVASLDSSDPFDSTQAMAVAGDGSVVAVGRTNTPPDGFSVVVTRYHPDGTPDESFGADGDGDARLVLDVIGAPSRAVVDAGGRTIIAIQTGFLGDAGIDVVRLKQDGSLDTAFGEGGKARAFFGHATDVTALKVEDDGKVLLGVIVYAPVPDPSEGSVRFNADGSMDESYAGGVVAKDDGGLGDIGAYDFRIRDESQPGAVTSARVQSPAVAAARQPDGKIVALDQAETEDALRSPAAVLRFNADGTVDPTFAHAAHPGGSSGTVAVQPGTGRILYAGGLHLAVIGLESAPPLDEPREVPPPEPAGDTSPPTVTLVPPPAVTAATTSGIEFVVRYADDAAVDLSSLDGNAVLVTSPDRSTAAAEKVGGPTATGPNEFSVTYRYTPAAGGFTADANGTYTISLAPDQVRDAAGNAAAAATLGTFDVNIPADAPNLTVREFFVRYRGRVPEVLVAGGRSGGVVSVAVGNSGARFAGRVTARLLASTDQTLDATDILLASRVRRLAIGPGSTRPVRMPLRRIPASIATGDFYLLADVDGANGVAETSELDNVTAAIGTTRIVARQAHSRRRRDGLLFADVPFAQL